MANMFVKRQDLRKKQLTDRERIQEDVKKEDFLIRQIDEFKDKAKQLQQLLDAKESRVQELQGIVEEREKRARGLQEILKEKQLEVDNITKGVEGYANQIARELAGRIEQLEDQIKEQALKEQELLAECTDSVKTLSEELAARQEEYFSGQAAKLDELYSGVSDMQKELSEKIHTENVKCYRNVQSSLDELKGQQSQEEKREESGSVKGLLKAAIVIGAVNLAALGGFILYELGVFGMFF